MPPRLLHTLLLAGLLTPLCVAAAPDSSCLPWVDRQPHDGAANEQQNLVFGQINIRVGDLFDPTRKAESTFIHSAANSLHLMTRPATIVQALPFAPGQPFSIAMVEEGERVLRAKRYLRDATITPLQICGNAVDVEIVTIDNWTLTPSVSIGSAGGENRYAFELQDLNLLGFGKELLFRTSSNGGNDETIFAYNDDNVLGSRYQVSVELADADQGERRGVRFSLPFYSSSSERSWSITVRDRVERVTASPDEVSTLSVAVRDLDLLHAWRIPRSTEGQTRMGIGVRLDQQESDTAEFPAADFPLYDYRERYPYVALNWAENRWSTRSNYRNLGKTEDINAGLTINLELGALLSVFDNARDAVRMDFRLTRGWYGGRDTLHKFSLQQIQYFDNEESSKRSLTARYEYFHWFNDWNQLDFRLTAATHTGYSLLYNLKLGGMEGLKAYPNEHQQGDRRWVGMVEYRHVNQWTPLELLHTAWTVFAEAGSAWSRTADPDLMSDVGFGLLLSPTRAAGAAINRFDIAFPLNKDGDTGDFQIYIGTQINY